MKIYLDTSSLVKLYHEEEGTEKIDEFLNNLIKLEGIQSLE